MTDLIPQRMRSAALLAAAVLHLAYPARSDVWEFDRSGKSLRTPSKYLSYNIHYDTNEASQTVPARESGGFAAIYRPMAEGVAIHFASDPAVTAAGLSAAEFTRLFVALIDQESRFNPSAISPKGARGLGQLMPETAAELGVRDAFEPMENLRGAARYLTAQLATFGRADLALAAYNAGPRRVSRYQGIPPFRETRDYVARITRAAALAPATRPSDLRAALEHVAARSVEPQTSSAQGTLLEW